MLGVDDSALGLDLDLEELDMEYRILFEVFPDLLSCWFWIVGRDGGLRLEYGLQSLSGNDPECLLQEGCYVSFDLGDVVVVNDLCLWGVLFLPLFLCLIEYVLVLLLEEA